jgi:hypothetical protein
LSTRSLSDWPQRPQMHPPLRPSWAPYSAPTLRSARMAIRSYSPSRMTVRWSLCTDMSWTFSQGSLSWVPQLRYGRRPRTICTNSRIPPKPNSICEESSRRTSRAGTGFTAYGPRRILSKDSVFAVKEMLVVDFVERRGDARAGLELEYDFKMVKAS